MLDALPDSRCKQGETKGSVMMDWPVGPLDGPTVRIEAIIAYCANCGEPLFLVPRENTISCTFLCDECHYTYGAIAGQMPMESSVFFEKVQVEMIEEHGHLLTPEETVRLMEQGRLGSGLEKLARESPVKVYNRT